MPSPNPPGPRRWPSEASGVATLRDVTVDLRPLQPRRECAAYRRSWGLLERLAGRRPQQALFLGVELDTEPAALALGDVDGVAVAAADLVKDGLAREAGACGGVGEADVAGGDLGDEAAADIVAELDSPGRVRCRLFGGQEPFAQPAADGLGADAELAGGFVDGDTVVAGRRRGAGRRGCGRVRGFRRRARR